jgi:hypothetical protein
VQAQMRHEGIQQHEYPQQARSVLKNVLCSMNPLLPNCLRSVDSLGGAGPARWICGSVR